MEIWKDIKGYEGLYKVSTFGNVKSNNKILKPYIEKGKRSNIRDSLYVSLSNHGKVKKFYIHRLVASTFLNNDDILNKIEVNHKDGDRYNNHVENLEWVSKIDNIRHAFKNKLIKTEKKVNQYSKDGEFIRSYVSESEACRQIRVTQGKISRSILRKGTCKGFKWEYAS